VDEADTDSDSDTDAATFGDARDWTPPPPTGVPAVDAAVEKLQELDGLPTGEHVAVYDEVHRLLQDALADLDGG
jgi:hypothetical protein